MPDRDEQKKESRDCGDEAITTHLPDKADDAPFFLGMSFVLRHLRKNARQAGIDLPKHLTPNPKDEAAYDNWRRQIDDHRHAAGERVKKLTPA